MQKYPRAQPSTPVGPQMRCQQIVKFYPFPPPAKTAVTPERTPHLAGGESSPEGLL